PAPTVRGARVAPGGHLRSPRRGHGARGRPAGGRLRGRTGGADRVRRAAASGAATAARGGRARGPPHPRGDAARGAVTARELARAVLGRVEQEGAYANRALSA